jgi:transposase-like protein
VHKTRKILEYLGDRDRVWAQAIFRRAYQATDVKTAQRLFLDLARRLEAEYPSAAESVRGGAR